MTAMSRDDAKPKQTFLFMTLFAGAAVGLSVALANRTDLIHFGAPREHPDTIRFTERSVEPVRFLGGLTSYEEAAAAQATLESGGQAPSLRTDHLKVDSRYPPRNYDTLVVKDYPYCGTRGQLTLEFFNDRLYEASFEPTNAASCESSLKVLYPELQRDANGRAEWERAPLRVANNLGLVLSDVGQALSAKPYVLWQDQRLLRQRDEWDERFSALASRVASGS